MVRSFLLMDMSEVILNSVLWERKKSTNFYSTKDYCCKIYSIILMFGGGGGNRHKLVL
jgi:hypothetical protein